MSDARPRDHRRETLRALPAVRDVVRAYRVLVTPGSRCVVACSGGADSTGLLLALWSAAVPIVVGHVVHDMRPKPECIADRDSVQSLCRELGCSFVAEEIEAKSLPGNLEANSRRLRYSALARIAAANGCGFVATAHHAQDQAETVLMRLLRGAGPRGLGGMSARRSLSKELRIKHVRPALCVTPEELRAVCIAAGVAWREDPTNRDDTHLRAAVRSKLVPMLGALAPGAVARICSAAELCRESAAETERAARALMERASRVGDGLVFTRAELRGQPAVVLGECLRVCAARGAESGRDGLTWSVVRPVVRAIKDRKEHRREFRVGPSLCIVDAARILIRALQKDES